MKYSKEQVRQENDKIRKSLRNSPSARIMITPTVNEALDKEQILETIKNFDSFNGDNDPHEEHDCAIVVVNNEKYMFKIDYYDFNLEYGVNPQEEDCIRVLTIMHVSEY